MDADVIVVGAGPTGLMLAGELRLAGVRPLVLERQPHAREAPKANGLSGQILRLLHYRGLLERFEAAGTDPRPAPAFPFGGVDLDLRHLADSPLHALRLPQSRLEDVLDERARELGADLHRGHEMVGLSQDDATVTADVRGPAGQYRVTARYLVGCDGPRSRVRDRVGIPFPGTTYPEVNRFGQLTVPDSVTRLGNGDLDVTGLGRIRAGFTRTDRGVFALGSLTPEVLLVLTTEEGTGEYDDDVPMGLTEFQDSIRRVLGADLPLGEPLRLSRFIFQARQAQRYRDGRILLAGDAAHLFPATGVALNAGLLDTVNLAWKLAAAVHGWAPAGLLDTYHDERHLAGARALLHTQAQVALRRGHDAAAEALREVFQELLVDEQPLRRLGALVAGTDIRYPTPGSNHHAMTGTFAPDLTLHTDQATTSVAELMHTARPILLDLADRADLRETVRDWQHRVDVHTAETDHRPADALLIRPDAHIAWAATIDEPTDTAALALRDALSGWFGTPLETTVPTIDRARTRYKGTRNQETSAYVVALAQRHDRALVDHWATPGHPSTDEFAASGSRPSVNVEEVAMRNEAMEQLDVLVGSWQTTMRNAWFLEPADREVAGSATVEWLGDAFVVFRWTMAGDVGKATSEMVLVLGRSDAHDAYTALYHDERGVCRVFAMTFDGSRWNLSREDPDMFQRFIADVGPDRIAGRWEASEDHGSTWRKDFDLVFERA